MQPVHTAHAHTHTHTCTLAHTHTDPCAVHQSYVLREAHALQCLNHQFISDYYGVIITSSKILFMLEVVTCGELWHLLYKVRECVSFVALSHQPPLASAYSSPLTSSLSPTVLCL